MMGCKTGPISCYLIVAICGFCSTIIDDSNGIDSLKGQEQVQIVLIDGQTLAASISAIDERGSVEGTGIDRPLALESISIISTERAVSLDKSKFLIHLVGGSVVCTDAISLANDRYRFTTVAGQFDLGAEAIRAIVSTADAGSSTLARLLREPNTTSDRVIAKTTEGEQTVAGLLKEVTADKIRLEFRGKVRPISFGKIAAIVLADLRQELPSGTRAKLSMRDGSVFVGTVRQLKDGVLLLGLVGADVALEWKQVAKVAVKSDRVLYVSDLQPIDVQQQAYGAARFTWQADKNVLGQALTLFDPESSKFKTYARGLGTHSYCRLDYSVGDMGFTQFRAFVGLDERSKHRGNCQVVVLGDGVELWSAHIHGDQAPQSCNVEVVGVSRLTLVVKTGQHLDLGDHVNWIDARLLKSD